MRRIPRLLLGLLLCLPPGGAAQDVELEHWIQAARAAYAQGELESARSLARQVLALDPANPQGLELERLLAADPTPRPELPVDPGTGTGAAPEIPFEDAVRMLQEDPSAADAPAWRAAIGGHWFRQARAAEESGSRAKALAAYRRAVVFAPDDPLLRYSYFQLLFKVQRLDEALVQAGEFLGRQPTGALAKEMRRQLVEVLIRLATTKMSAGRWDQATSHLEKALELGPEGGTAMSVRDSLATCYFALGRDAGQARRDLACRAYTALVALRPGDEIARAEFDARWMEKLRTNALPVLWAEAKAAKAAGRLIDAYGALGAVLVLSKDPWMVKLANQYRQEIRDVAGDSVDAEASRAGLPGGLEGGEPPPASGGALPAATTTGPMDLEAELYRGAAAPTPPPGMANPPGEDDEFGAPTPDSARARPGTPRRGAAALDDEGDLGP